MKRLGDLMVPAMGLGCMGMSAFYGAERSAETEREALATIDRALEVGVGFLDTADMYGVGANEELVGRAIRGRRDRFVVATKFGIVVDPDDLRKRRICGRPDYVRAACDASLRRLGVDTIDLYYLHRLDPDVPVEDTVGAMADLVRAGKVRHLGLSEVDADTLRRACVVHPIAALQTEYSLWSREPEDGLITACRALGTGFVAYSPLGRGFLTGAIRSPDDFAPDDVRRFFPRFVGENFRKNLDLVAKVEAMAAERGVTPAQLALAWVMARGDDVVPIPGTRRRVHLDDNILAMGLALDDDDLAALDAIAPDGVAAGARYPEQLMGAVKR
ncbi:MAG: aldo/keto reductase [Myxococcales bacterium]|nr:aldo/keto reductase [Myxococcales bacterium]MCB9731793.1 aldo/keto reductase [Deltaproteobacteria bacterium]